MKHESIYKTIIKAPVHKVWHALTDAAMVEQYFFGTKQHTDWTPGSEVTRKSPACQLLGK